MELKKDSQLMHSNEFHYNLFKILIVRWGFFLHKFFNRFKPKTNNNKFAKRLPWRYFAQEIFFYS